MSEAVAFPISMSLADWLWADAGIDNIVSLASEIGPVGLVKIGTEIREAGWAVTRGPQDREREYGRRPPSQEVQREAVTVSLNVDAWAFVVMSLRSGELGEARIGRDQDAARTATLRTSITTSLDTHAGDWRSRVRGGAPSWLAEFSVSLDEPL